MQRYNRIYLVACVKGKLPRPAPARDLYTSDWFRKARQYVEQSGAPWFILSDEHGLVHPDTELVPYEKDIKGMLAADRSAWAERVQEQMETALPPAGEVVILAGQNYRQHLIGYLTKRFGKVSVPMERLRIGEQQQWLGRAIAGNSNDGGR